MSLTSIEFLLFAMAVVFLYYILPKRVQWYVLLAASLLFYSLAGMRSVVYILVTASSTYVATRMMQQIADRQRAAIRESVIPLSREEKTNLKASGKRRRKRVMIACLILNFGILCAFKYFHFALAQLNALLSVLGGREIPDTFRLLVPLGISFYTFQTVGYLIDVFWEKVDAERNFGKVLLFVSFFPQIIQGPISDFKHLSNELFTPHAFTYRNYSFGCQRILWGFFKKLVIADTLTPYVLDVFTNYSQYPGITVLFGAFLYAVQIYADFSGYMDIVCGFCEILGIRLLENFKRPYFSKSVAEYWRRWHISLGVWFKTYLYYPIGVAKWNQRLGKSAQTWFGKAFGQTASASVALVAVWLTTGLWHGASWAYIAWGGLNGLFIILSLWLEPVYAAAKSKLHISERTAVWRAFQVLRTFLLLMFIKVLPEVGTLRDGLGFWRQIFINREIPRSLSALMPYDGSEVTLFVLMIGLFLMLAVSLISRRQSMREYLATRPTALRWILFLFLFFMIALFGSASSAEAGGFMYAGF